MKFITKGGSGSNNFLKLEAGESVRGVFRGDPIDYKQHFVKSEMRSYLCSGAGCSLCNDGKASFRFRINFVVNENGAYTPKIWETGWTTYEALKSLHESDYDLEKYVMKITRHGKGTDTTYSIVPQPNGQLTAEQEKQISAIKLIEITIPSKKEEAIVKDGEEIFGE